MWPFKKSSVSVPYNRTVILIDEISQWYWRVHKRVQECVHGSEQFDDAVTYVNDHLKISCPMCELLYNESGFQLQYLAAMQQASEQAKGVIAIGEGLLTRFLSGLCPNPNCNSRAAVIQWIGDDLG